MSTTHLSQNERYQIQHLHRGGFSSYRPSTPAYDPLRTFNFESSPSRMTLLHPHWRGVTSYTPESGVLRVILLVHFRGCGATLVVAELDRLAH